MKNNLLKKIGRITLLVPILYFSSPSKNAIAPEENTIEIIYSEPIKKDTRKVIIIDPGHGMENRDKDLMDWGMIYPDFNEAEIVLEKSKKIKETIDSTKYRVILTRKDNTTPCPIESRPEIANTNNAALFISIHTNDYKGWKSISGSEVYYRKENNKELKDKSRELAKLLAKNLEEISGIKNRVIMQEDYLMLKDVKCPAILLDIGYLLNKDDKEKILNQSGVEKSVAKTIEEYLN
jgi:N-acetylmuramoyl-L-alanine amidase